MSIFDRFSTKGESRGEPRITDEHRINLGADAGVTPSGDARSVNPAISEARASATRTLETSARRRGRPPQGTAASGGDKPNVPSPELAAEIARQLEQCYDPRAWGALLAAPGDVMTVLADRPEKWRVTKDERETLGACGSAFARTLLVSNPRTLAALMLGSALFAVYMPRMIDEAKYRRDKADGKAKTGETTA